LIGFSVIFACSLLLAPFVGNEFIPEEDSGDVRVTVQLPIGTRVEESDKVAKRIEDIFVNEVPERRYLFVRSGQMAGAARMSGQAAGSHIVFAGVKLVSKTERKRSVKEVGQTVRREIAKIPGVLKVDITTGNPLGQLITGTGGKSIQVEIIGHSFEDTDAVANQLKKLWKRSPVPLM
jgi:HAE1 family hydrophobic/amphiphilic exporter-1